MGQDPTLARASPIGVRLVHPANVAAAHIMVRDDTSVVPVYRRGTSPDVAVARVTVTSVCYGDARDGRDAEPPAVDRPVMGRLAADWSARPPQCAVGCLCWTGD